MHYNSIIMHREYSAKLELKTAAWNICFRYIASELCRVHDQRHHKWPQISHVHWKWCTSGSLWRIL